MRGPCWQHVRGFDGPPVRPRVPVAVREHRPLVEVVHGVQIRVGASGDGGGDRLARARVLGGEGQRRPGGGAVEVGQIAEHRVGEATDPHAALEVHTEGTGHCREPRSPAGIHAVPALPVPLRDLQRPGAHIGVADVHAAVMVHAERRVDAQAVARVHGTGAPAGAGLADADEVPAPLGGLAVRDDGVVVAVQVHRDVPVNVLIHHSAGQPPALLVPGILECPVHAVMIGDVRPIPRVQRQRAVPTAVGSLIHHLAAPAVAALGHVHEVQVHQVVEADVWEPRAVEGQGDVAALGADPRDRLDHPPPVTQAGELEGLVRGIGVGHAGAVVAVHRRGAVTPDVPGGVHRLVVPAGAIQPLMPQVTRGAVVREDVRD